VSEEFTKIGGITWSTLIVRDCRRLGEQLSTKLGVGVAVEGLSSQKLIH
jgi:hypothetical protein